ncbi:MAG: MFS transporter [Bacteroidales bacterium]|nr:MFS transporter [Bacteroidales bacterium]
MQKSYRNPFLWVPTLYLVEGLPYFIVNTISIIVLKDLGMENGPLALLTSLISLPWMIKPLWSPFVDIFRSKRWWVLTTQFLMVLSVALLAITLPKSSPFTLTLILFVITGFASATHDISADGFYMIAMNEKWQSGMIGVRNTFYRIAMVFGQGVLVVAAGLLENRSGDVCHAWTVTLLIASGFLAVLAIYHLLVLPKPEEDAMQSSKTAKDVMKEFGNAFSTFFAKKGVWFMIAFMLLYRLPEAFSVKMLYPFFVDDVTAGGLGLDKAAYGIVYGTAGVVALLVGGILGGIMISRKDLRNCIIPMALSLALPCAVYLYMAIAQPQSLWTIGTCVVFDQFGYGFGFTAYTIYMMRFAQGPLKTSHFAICTGFMALSMLLPGLVAGYLQTMLGYVGFFILVMLCCFATVFISFSARRRLQ